MTPPRALFRRSVELLTQILTDPSRPADRQVEWFFKRHRDMGVNDRGFVAEAIYSCLRQRRVFESLAQGGAADRLIACYLIGQGWSTSALQQAGFGPDPHALVERVHQVDVTQLPAPVQSNLPDSLLELLVPQVGEPEIWKLAAALNRSATVDLRVNTLKASREEVAERLKAEGFPAEPTPFSPVGLRRRDHAPLFSTRTFQDGLFEIQDEASQLVALLLEPRRGERIVDYCAGAGGKTLHIGALMANTGTIYAFDVSAKRLAQLSPRLARTGLSNARPMVIAKGRDQHVRRLADKMDRVLVDAPCTGLGTLRRNPDIKWRPLRVEELAREQAQILASAARLVKPGGRLVYSTCSLLIEENEAVLSEFLGAHLEFIHVSVEEILRRRHLSIPEAVTAAGDLRLFPHRHDTDGFFASVLERQI